jgi:EmrB/QacA subfamily drug resistance transporter
MSAHPDSKPGRFQRGLALAATIIASSMGFIDGTIVHIALPAIQKDLNTSFAALQWIANTYLLALCALMVISGALGDRYGPRRLFIIGIIGFTLSSAACAAATTSTWLIVARTLQGVFAALMLPQSLSIIARLYPPEQRGRAIGIWSMSASASAAAGPVVGGFLVDNGGWPYAFWVNIPLGVIALVLTLQAVPRGNQRRSVPLDWPGAVLLVSALAALVFATINVSLYSLHSPQVWPGWVCGLLLLVGFFYWERRVSQPILPAHFTANREFVLLNAYCLTVFTAFTAMMFLVPYVLISSLGLSASTTALNMLPLGVCISLMARPVGAWADKIGYRTPMIAGAMGIAAATALAGLIVWIRTPWAGAIAMTMLGVTAGLMVTPLTTGVLNSVHTDESGLASGINHAVSRIGSLISVALFGALLAVRYRYHLPDSLAASVVDDQSRMSVALVVQDAAGSMAPVDLGALPVELHMAAQESFTRALDAAFVEVMLISSVFALGAAGCAFALSQAQPKKVA